MQFKQEHVVWAIHIKHRSYARNPHRMIELRMKGVQEKKILALWQKAMLWSKVGIAAVEDQAQGNCQTCTFKKRFPAYARFWNDRDKLPLLNSYPSLYPGMRKHHTVAAHRK